MSKSKWIGMSWMVLSLGAATIAGAVGVAFFHGTLDNPEHVFIDSVKQTFHPFVVGFVLCAIVAATINAMSSQILVLCSELDGRPVQKNFSRRSLRPRSFSTSRASASSSRRLSPSIIALDKQSTIYGLVSYAWSGIGPHLDLSSFYLSPLFKINRYGALGWDHRRGSLCRTLASRQYAPSFPWSPHLPEVSCPFSSFHTLREIKFHFRCIIRFYEAKT